MRISLPLLLGVLIVAVAWRWLPAPDAKALDRGKPLAASAPRSATAAVAPQSPPVVDDAEPAAATAAPDQQADFVDIDTAKAFRASPSQRADDARRLREVADLADFGADLSERALKGDADAAQALADLLVQCGMAYGAQSDPETWRNLRFYGQYDDARVQAAAQAVMAQQSRCSAFAQTDPEWYDWQAQQWNNLAAELGNPVAAAERRPDDLRTAEARSAYAIAQRAALERVLDESGAEALARHAMALAGVSGLRYEAFSIAACTLNPVCAADPQNYPLNLMQSGQLGSNFGTYIGLLMMTPRERQIAQSQAEHILRLWRARRFAELLAAQTSIALGGP